MYESVRETEQISDPSSSHICLSTLVGLLVLLVSCLCFDEVSLCLHVCQFCVSVLVISCFILAGSCSHVASHGSVTGTDSSFIFVVFEFLGDGVCEAVVLPLLVFGPPPW